MNVLALYDIHGNLDALEAVLADPRGARPDVVVVGGDAVPGPFARATLDRLDALEVPVHWVRGNGEREVADAVGAPAPAEDDLIGRFAAITACRRVVVGGHTHQQDDRDVGGVRFVNAGSVGLPYEGDGAARWLWVSGGVPELRSTAYDHAAAGERMLAAGWPDEQSIGGALIDPVEPMVVTRIFEERA